MSSDRPSMYERVGGREWFVALVDRFYDAIADEPLVRPMYPRDLSGPRQHLSLFLIQYWGGPSDYEELRGHPRLRWRHRNFPIGQAERKAWLRHMSAAVRAGGLSSEDEVEMIEYFTWVSATLVNRPQQTPPGARSLPVISAPAPSDE